MKSYKAFVNVYFSKQVEIEVKAHSEEDARQQIINDDCNHKIDEKLEGDDFKLSTNYCDDFAIDSIEMKG